MATYQYLDASGVIVADPSDVLADVQAEYVAALGSGLSLAQGTPQGMLIAAETEARIEVIDNNAAVANQINPNIAGGVFLDAIWALTGGQRTAAQYTAVSGVTVTGVPGSVLPAGSTAKTAAGDIFATTDAATFDAVTGVATVNFVATVAGPVPCAADALNAVAAGVPGWETVNNTTAGVVGAATQSDASARLARRNTLALQSAGIAKAVTSALYAVPGVTSVGFQENYTSTTQTIGGITMPPNSMYACVAGGDDTAIAAALLGSKNGGCGWVGDTTVDYTDPYSGQVYAVQFDRPTAVPILVVATVRANSSVANPQASATQAMLDYAAGLVAGEPGFTIAGDVSAFQLAGAVNSEVPGLYVQNVLIAVYPSGTPSTAEIPIGINQQATLSAANITVNVLT